MTAVRFEDIRLLYGDTPALDGVTLTVESGELLPVLGPSGCGKTSLLRILAGLTVPDSGRVFIGEDLVNDPAPRLAAHRRGIGMVFQNLALWPHLTVMGNLEFGLKARGTPRLKRRVQALEVLDRVGLAGFQDRMPAALSGGERQRVALARALVAAPRLLLLDEPLSSVDAMLKDDLLGQIRRINQTLNLTTFYVTHDKEEALALGRRIAVMEGGILVQVAPPEALYARPANRFVATLMGTNNLFWAKVDEAGACTPLPDVDPSGTRPPGASLVAVRPEGLALEDGGEGIQGEVEGAVFQGEAYLVRVRCGALDLKVRNREAVAPGTAVTVAIREKPRVLE